MKKNEEQTLFISDENDISYVKLTDVIKILPNAIMKQKGSRLYYECNEPIDVYERR